MSSAAQDAALRPRVVISLPPVMEANPYQRLLYQHLASDGWRVRRLNAFRAHALWRLRRERPLLHFHWPQSYYQHDRGPESLRGSLSWIRLTLFAARLLFARLLGSRIVWTVHQIYPHEADSRQLDRRAASLLARFSNALIVHDHATAVEVAAKLPRGALKLHSVPHGSYRGVYPPGRPRALVRQELGIAVDAFVFLSFGHLRPYKETELLLESFAAADISNSVLVIAGEPLDERVSRMISKAVATDMRIKPLLRFIPDEQVAELFGAADAVVLARGDGGTSGALILALSFGVPVVAARTLLTEELTLAGRAGWLFEVGNAGSLMAVLTEAATGGGDSAIRRAAASEAADRLDWPEAANLTARVFEGEQTTPDLLLVCSSGGHLLQLFALREAWKDFSRLWVTDDTPDTRSVLTGEPLVFGRTPTTRSARAFVSNFRLGWRLIGRFRPRAVLTTGAGVAVPLAWAARLRGVRVVFVESLTRVESPSLSCRLISPIADRTYVQWPQLQTAVRGSRYVGSVIGGQGD